MKKESVEQTRLAYEAGTDRIRTYHVAYVVMLSLITVFEIYMTVRGLLFWDFSKPFYLTYLIAYLVLLVASAVTLGALLINRKRGTVSRFVMRLVNVYGVIIILWATVISLIDVVRGNTMIVYLTVIMIIAAVLNMKPVLYAFTVVPTAVLLVFQAIEAKSVLVDSNGYLINLGVFVIFSVVLAFVQSHLTVKAFAAKKNLEHLSFYDQLTGVYNRHSLKEHIAAMSKTDIFYFGIIDVDNFKSVNDTFGHDVGDTCLKSIAELLSKHFGKLIYRYGGDEFVAITHQREADLSRHIEEINDTLSEQYGDKNIHISAGFYCPVCDEEEYRDYFKKADTALYEAKTSGKRKAVIYK